MTESAKSDVLKITVVGDGTVGKTSLLMTFIKNEFPDEYVPTVFDNFTKDITVNGITYKATLWDTAGNEEYSQMRILGYPNTNCFVLCYAIDNQTSYTNIDTKWLPEIQEHNPNTPIVLVATKLDLRDKERRKYIRKWEGMGLKRKIGAYSFIETSAMSRINIQEVFESAVVAKKTNGVCEIC